jgi:hypothetical protein
MKNYYENNKNHHKMMAQKNYKSKQVKTVCECGRTISLVSVRAHLISTIHRDMMKIRQLSEK